MQARLILRLVYAFSIPLRTRLVEKGCQETLESSSVLLWLFRACGQKPQLAVQLWVQRQVCPLKARELWRNLLKHEFAAANQFLHNLALPPTISPNNSECYEDSGKNSILA
jgi:hypothetical protein